MLPLAFLLQCVNDGKLKGGYAENTSSGIEVSTNVDRMNALVFCCQDQNIVPFDNGDDDNSSPLVFSVKQGRLCTARDKEYTAATLSLNFRDHTNSTATLLVNGKTMNCEFNESGTRGLLGVTGVAEVNFCVVPVSRAAFGFAPKYFQLQCMGDGGELQDPYLASSHNGWFIRSLPRYIQQAGDVFQDDGVNGVSCFGGFTANVDRGLERVGVLQVGDQGVKVSSTESDAVLRTKYEAIDSVQYLSFHTADGLPIVLDKRELTHDTNETDAMYLKCGQLGESAAKFRYHQVYQVAPSTYHAREFTRTSPIKTLPSTFLLQCVNEGEFDGRYLEASESVIQLSSKFDKSNAQVFRSQGSNILPLEYAEHTGDTVAFGSAENNLCITRGQATAKPLCVRFKGATNSFASLVLENATLKLAIATTTNPLSATLSTTVGVDVEFYVVPVAPKYFQLQCMGDGGELQDPYLASSHNGFFIRSLPRYIQQAGDVFQDDGVIGVSSFGGFTAKSARGPERVGVLQVGDQGVKVSDKEYGKVLRTKYEAIDSVQYLSFYTANGLPIVLDKRELTHDTNETDAMYLKCGQLGESAAKFRYHQVYQVAPGTYSDRRFMNNPFKVQGGNKQLVWQQQLDVTDGFIVMRNLYQDGVSVQALHRLFTIPTKHGVYLADCLTQQTVSKSIEILEFFLISLHGQIDQPSISGGATFRQLAMGSKSPAVRAFAKQAQLYLGRYIRDEKVLHQSKTCTVYSATDIKSSETGMQTSKLVLKVMKVQEQYDRESAIYRKLFGEDVSEDERSERQKHFVELVHQHPKHLCLVLKIATRSLEQVYNEEDIVGYYEQAPRVVAIMYDLGLALGYMHTNLKMIHGDFKPKNAVRVNGDYKLIDYDASVSIRNDNNSHLTGKCSSAYAAPEIACSLPEAKGYLDEKQKEKQEFLKELVVAGVAKQDAIEIVAKRLPSATPSNTQQLPPTPDPKQDVWSFGVVLYEMSSGTKLFKENTQDNITEKSEFLRLVNWKGLTDAEKAQVFKDATSTEYVKSVVSLIDRCLQPNPYHRPNMAEVCSELFSLGNSNDLSEVLNKVNGHLERSVEHQRMLAKLIMEVDEMVLPSHWYLLESGIVTQSEIGNSLKRVYKTTVEKVKNLCTTKYQLVLIDEATLKSHVCKDINFHFVTEEKQKFLDAAKLIAFAVRMAIGIHLAPDHTNEQLKETLEQLQAACDSEVDQLSEVPLVDETEVKQKAGENMTKSPFLLQQLFNRGVKNTNARFAMEKVGFVRVFGENGDVHWIHKSSIDVARKIWNWQSANNHTGAMNATGMCV